MNKIDLKNNLNNNNININNNNISKKIYVDVRDFDGYVNATSLCKIYNRAFKHWYKTNRTKKYLKKLKKYYNGIKLIHLGSTRVSPTFVHPIIAVTILKWCNVEMEIILNNKYIINKIEKNENLEIKYKVLKKHKKKIEKDYYNLFGKINKIKNYIEQNDITLPCKLFQLIYNE